MTHSKTILVLLTLFVFEKVSDFFRFCGAVCFEKGLVFSQKKGFIQFQHNVFERNALDEEARIGLEVVTNGEPSAVPQTIIDRQRRELERIQRENRHVRIQTRQQQLRERRTTHTNQNRAQENHREAYQAWANTIIPDDLVMSIFFSF